MPGKKGGMTLALRREDVFINLVEVTEENWSFGNGEVCAVTIDLKERNAPTGPMCSGSGSAVPVWLVKI